MSGIKKMFLLLGILIIPLVFMGDFCEDILGVPVYFSHKERLNLKIDANDFVKPAPQAPAAGDYDIDAEIPEDLEGIDIPEDFEIPEEWELPEDFEIPEDIDIDLDGLLPNKCEDTHPSEDKPGENCLCIGNDNRVYIKEGCVLGNVTLDIASLDKSIKDLKKYITGIYIRKLHYNIQAKETPFDIPKLDIFVRPVKKDKDEYVPISDWTELGTTDAVSAGVLNKWLFDYIEKLEDKNTSKEEKEKIQKELDELEPAIAECDEENSRYCSCQEETVACQNVCAPNPDTIPPKFQCATPNRLKLRMDNIDMISKIFKTLTFQIKVSFKDSVDVSKQINQIVNMQEIKMQMKLSMELVIIVMPPN